MCWSTAPAKAREVTGRTLSERPAFSSGMLSDRCAAQSIGATLRDLISH